MITNLQTKTCSICNQ